MRKIRTERSFCRRYNGRMVEQQMADLSMQRTRPDYTSFTYVRIEYFGPIEVQKGQSTVKHWRVTFTCLSSSTVHLEIANSLDTHWYSAPFHLEGHVAHIQSDNATNFMEVKGELREALESLNHTHIQGALWQKGDRWNFNPPAGSHHGGDWILMDYMQLCAKLKPF